MAIEIIFIRRISIRGRGGIYYREQNETAIMEDKKPDNCGTILYEIMGVTSQVVFHKGVFVRILHENPEPRRNRFCSFIMKRVIEMSFPPVTACMV